MNMQSITHQWFRYGTEVKGREEWEVEAHSIGGWLLLIVVGGLTVFLVISFSLL